jgi:hypothetical protein
MNKLLKGMKLRRKWRGAPDVAHLAWRNWRGAPGVALLAWRKWRGASVAAQLAVALMVTIILRIYIYRLYPLLCFYKGLRVDVSDQQSSSFPTLGRQPQPTSAAFVEIDNSFAAAHYTRFMVVKCTHDRRTCWRFPYSADKNYLKIDLTKLIWRSQCVVL